MKTTQQSIIIVDDDKSILNALQTSLASVTENISIFDSPVKCLKEITLGKYDLLITDINMPQMNGVAVLKQAKEIDPGLAVLVITGYADISLAVKTLKMGAVDFIEKPFGYVEITSTVKKILASQLEIGRENMRKLTKSELRILAYIVQGHSNSYIAHSLSRSVRTIEDHRCNMMQKLKVSNIVELIQRASEIGFGKKSEETEQ